MEVFKYKIVYEEFEALMNYLLERGDFIYMPLFSIRNNLCISV